MILREDLLNPIPGDNPRGVNLRDTAEFDEIKEARREEDDLPQGVWKRARKVANYQKVIELAQNALAAKGKHLQVAAWLTEALLKEEGFSGLNEGLRICYGLLDKFWDTLYPLPDDGELEARAQPLQWTGSKLVNSVKSVPLTIDGYSWSKFAESRSVGRDLEKAIQDGKLSADAFEKSRDRTSKSFYVNTEKALKNCLDAVVGLNRLCTKKFGDSGPSFQPLNDALEEIRDDVHGWLKKKRETDPDPIEAVPESTDLSVAGPEAAQAIGAMPPSSLLPATPAPFIPVQAAAECADQRDAMAAIAAGAAFVRKLDPYSPAPFLAMRGLRWGELRAALAARDPTAMEAPPTEIRQLVKKLALNGDWKQVLDAAENVMSLPCSRAWLDLQRFVIEACAALGEEYNSIAVAIRSELRGLVRDFPELLDARLMDDTAVANPETQAWLRGLIAEPDNAAPELQPAPRRVSDNHAPGWQKTFIDGRVLALEALRAGQEQKAFEILLAELQREQSGRGRFQRKLQLVQLCIAARKDGIAQPLLEDITATIDNHKLEDWEDREFIAGALATILRSSKRVQGDAKEKQKLFERICRLDPVQALNCQ